ncbi:hypothetical protein Tco_0966437 [Tanacetum coccineum]
MGELTFFLGLQVTQKDDGIFISQDKYVDEILKKFGFSTMKTASTPMETSKPLMKDESAEDVDVHLYRSMIGSLMYLTSSRPDIMFVVCACARFQVTPKVLLLQVVKRIFRYLKGQLKLGLWYPKDLPFNLEAYTDSDYAGASLDRYALMVNPTIYTSCIKQFWATAKAKTVNGEKKQPRRKQRKDTEVPQPSGSIESITDEAANEEHVPTHSNNPLLSGEDRLKLNELMELYTKLSERVLDLENTKTSQAAQRRKIVDLDAYVDVTLVDKAQGRNDDLMFDTRVFDELIEIKSAKPKAVITTATTTTTAVTRPKARGVLV